MKKNTCMINKKKIYNYVMNVMIELRNSDDHFGIITQMTKLITMITLLRSLSKIH